jgi:rubrerythrin
MATYDFFKRAEQVEHLAADIYALAARTWAGEGPLADLFQRLAEEETQHAARIRLLAARCMHDRNLMGGLGSAQPDVEAALDSAMQILGQLTSAGSGMDLNALKGMLGEMEKRFAAFHAQAMSAAAHPELQKFFARLAEQDRGHLELLQRPWTTR